TQEIKNLPNQNINYKKFLITNVEMSVILIFVSIIVSIFYMLLSSSEIITTINSYYCFLLKILSFLSIFITILVIYLSINDILLLSSKLK
ncbi:hypothetical protein, partial [Aliarcobacter butzleri]|uniref:hypothetical protein n=1 Tax=Aliarcobacter butzleri TaxID=28197 RepID=UPI001D02A387